MMVTLSMNDLKTRGASSLPVDEPAMLIVNSKPRAAILPYDEYELMIKALEELEDIALVKARLDEEAIDLDKAFELVD